MDEVNYSAYYNISEDETLKSAYKNWKELMKLGLPKHDLTLKDVKELASKIKPENWYQIIIVEYKQDEIMWQDTLEEFMRKEFY